MTDVIDDSLSWEQRREIRRKKRQELLAEADRVVKTPVSQVTTNDDNDTFEQERQRRRRDREEKRRKEREELEKQLKEEDEARAERERRREERKRQREEGEAGITRPVTKETYSYESEGIRRYSEEESVDKETSAEEADHEPNVTAAENEDRDAALENGVETHKTDADEGEEGHDSEDYTHTTEVSITIGGKKKSVDDHEMESEESSDKDKDEGEQEEEYNSYEEGGEKEPAVSYSESRQEKRRQREQNRIEEEKREKAETERRQAEYEAKLKREKEERERRMAESEAKRRELAKQSSFDSQPLSPKGNAAAPLIEKMKDLSEKMAESPKTHKLDTSIAKISSLDDRLKTYTSKAQRQETAKKTTLQKPGGSDVANRLNMWESGRVAGPDKTAKKIVDTAVVKQSTGVSSRKNLWESRQVGSTAEKKSARAEVHGADLTSRKNMWLKVTQESTKSSPVKHDDTQVIKTGVLSRLNKWEKGEVSGSSGTPKSKASDLPSSDVVNRRTKWENRAQQSPNQTSVKKSPAVRPMITSDISSRKHAYESKTKMGKAAPDRTPPSSTPKEMSDTEEKYGKDEDRESLGSRSDDDDDDDDDDDEQVLSDPDDHLYDQQSF